MVTDVDVPAAVAALHARDSAVLAGACGITKILASSPEYWLVALVSIRPGGRVTDLAPGLTSYPVAGNELFVFQHDGDTGLVVRSASRAGRVLLIDDEAEDVTMRVLSRRVQKLRQPA